MKEYEYIPQKNQNRLKGLLIILIAVSAVLFMTPMLIEQISFYLINTATVSLKVSFRWVFQLLGVIALVGAIFIVTRYMAKSFIYTVWVNDNGTRDLTVCELINGKKRTTVCRIGISNITEAHLLYPEKGEDKIKEKELSANARAEYRKSFDYCHDIGASPVCVLLVEECGEKLLIKLTCTDVLFGYFKAE